MDHFYNISKTLTDQGAVFAYGRGSKAMEFPDSGE